MFHVTAPQQVSRWFESVRSAMPGLQAIDRVQIGGSLVARKRLLFEGKVVVQPDFALIDSSKPRELVIAGEFNSAGFEGWSDMLAKFSSYADTNVDGFICVQNNWQLIRSVMLLADAFQNEEIFEIDGCMEAFFLFSDKDGTHFWTPDTLLNDPRNTVAFEDWFHNLKYEQPAPIFESISK